MGLADQQPVERVALLAVRDAGPTPGGQHDEAADRIFCHALQIVPGQAVDRTLEPPACLEPAPDRQRRFRHDVGLPFVRRHGFSHAGPAAGVGAGSAATGWAGDAAQAGAAGTADDASP